MLLRVPWDTSLDTFAMTIQNENILPRATAAAPDHWSEMARHWSTTGPPLRPSSEDIDCCTGAIRDWKSRPTALRALILGVTPELYGLPWPGGTTLLAADRSPGMIETVWPGRREQALLADWCALPLEPASQDIVVCDGGISVLAYPAGLRSLAAGLQRIVAPNGLGIFRLYVPPGQLEAPEAVFKDLGAGRIPSVNALKLRLWMTRLGETQRGVAVHDVWELIHQFEPDFTALAERLGWPLDHVLVLNAYRDSPARYYFPSIEEVCECFCARPGGFRLESIHVPAYELGPCCPTVVLRRAGSRELGEDSEART